MDQDTLNNIGLVLKEGIITSAEFLTLSDSRPGLIAALLVLLALALGIAYFFRTHGQLSAVRDLDRRVRAFDTIDSFASGYAEFQHSLRSDFRRKGTRETVWEAWDEFNETVVPDDIDGPVRMRNSIRPASFLNIEDLGFGSGFYRILPNTFVSLGLFLTFLGLVAALHQFSESMTAASESAMEVSITAASEGEDLDGWPRALDRQSDDRALLAIPEIRVRLPERLRDRL